MVDRARATAVERVELWDATVVGLGLRVYAGRASFVLRHKPRGRARQLKTLGDAGVMPLAEARDKARRLLAEHELGLAKARGVTVTHLVEHFLKNHRSRKKGRAPSEDPDTRRRCSLLVERLGSRLANEVVHGDVAALLSEITARGAAYEANRTRALLRLIWNLARQWGFVPPAMVNPTDGTATNRERARDVRALKAPELARLLAAAGRYPNPWAGGAVMLLAFTGARTGEVLSLPWEDVDLAAGVMVLRDRKRGDTLTLPLASGAVDLLRSLPKQKGSRWLFPSPRDPGRHLVDLRKPWAAILRDADLPSTTRVHDVRAAVATNVEASAGLKVASLVLGHADERTTMRYIRPASDDLRRAVEAHGRAVRGAAATTKRRKAGTR